jgi:gliding motility-associated-like protein
MKKLTIDMKSFIILACIIFTSINTYFAQSNDCSAATIIPVTATCSAPLSGSTLVGFTQSFSGCTGNADDDGWYSFTATATSHRIFVTPGASYDIVVEVFSGACNALVSLTCADNAIGLETVTLNALTIGNVYTFRVYEYSTGGASFTVCVTNLPAAPSNNLCTSAITLPVNTICTYTNGTTDGATLSMASCAGTADDDVWYTFTATNALQRIKVHPTNGMDPVVQVLTGTTCTALNNVLCTDATLIGQDEEFDMIGLTPGTVYYIRVYDYYASVAGNFQICITGAATAAPTNDNPCAAIVLPPVTANCNYQTFSNVAATASIAAGIPAPTACLNWDAATSTYLAPTIGGFSATSKDVWFKIVIPSSGNIYVTAKPNAGGVTDGVMALYNVSGSCPSPTFTQVACSDDHNYPGGANDALPLLSLTGQTPGSSVYLRYWGYGSGAGTFGLCVTTATNDACVNALEICDLNGFSASTSAAFTADRPGNMFANNETSTGVNLANGTNSGGVFGSAGSWGTGSPAFDVNIENNSWIKFIASSTSAVLNVAVGNCFVGNYPSGGIQMQIFSGNNCGSFVPVSNFQEGSTNFTITANSLVTGNTYYLMIDGYASDICNYTITALSGVQFPNIPTPAPICLGASATLTAPTGVGTVTYDWQHNGATTQSISVTPPTTSTYLCEVTGICGKKQMLSVTVVVKPNPVLNITQGASANVCAGSSVSLTATGATTYSWSGGAGTSPTTSVSPVSTTNYTVTGTTNGCTGTDVIAVTVNPLPTLITAPTATPSNCGGATGALTAVSISGTNPIIYTWTNASGTNVGSGQNVSNLPAGAYFLNVADANTCINNFGPFNVVNPGAAVAPIITAADLINCIGASTTMSASNVDPTATYTWSGPMGFTSSQAGININNISVMNAGNYCVYSTVAGCTGPSTCANLVVVTPPNVGTSTANNDTSICISSSFTLNAYGAVSYSWTGPNGFALNGATGTYTALSTTQSGLYTVTGTDSEGCTNTADINIIVLNLPNVAASASAATYCLGSNANLNASGANAYAWTGPNGFTSVLQNPVVSNMSSLEIGTYSVIATDLEGCINSATTQLNVDTDIAAVATTSDSIVCPDEPFTLSATGGISYQWNGPDNFISTNPTITVNQVTTAQTGWYYVTIIDSIGCFASDSTYVLVSQSGKCFVIPTLLTPNGDNHNDNWYIPGLENYPNASVQIFNRWGSKVFEADKYSNDWDGRVNRGFRTDIKNGKVPAATYYFILNLNENNSKPYKGYIELQY